MAEPNQQASGGTQAVEAVVRAFRLLDCFEQGQPELTLGEFVRRSGYSKTTTYRLLVTLQKIGWLERSPDGAFRLTMKPFRLGSILIDSLELRNEAGPVMAELGARWSLTVYLIVPSEEAAVCLERIDSGQAIRIMSLHVGGSQPFHLGAGPRVLLAFGPPERVDALIERGLVSTTPDSIVDAEALRADVELTRERGYAVSMGDMTVGVGAVGAPIFDRSGAVVASLSVGGLLEDFRPPRAEQIVADVVDCARRISLRLGHSGAPVGSAARA